MREKRLRLRRRHDRIRPFSRAVARALDRLRDLVDPDLMQGDGIRRFDVFVETHQRVVAGEAAVVEVQDRAADRTEAQRFVHHHLQRLLFERRELLHALVEIGSGEECRAQFVDRNGLAFVGGLARALRSRGGDAAVWHPASAISVNQNAIRCAKWRCASARDFPSNVGRECIAPLDRGSWRVSPFCPVW